MLCSLGSVMRVNAGQAGFTLLELMIACTLLAVLGLTAALSLNSGLAVSEQLQQRSEQLKYIDQAVVLLQRDLTQLLPRANRRMDAPEQRQAFWGYGKPEGPPGLLMEFVRKNPWPEGPVVGLQRVRYRLVGQRLVRETVPVADPGPDIRWQQRNLLTNVDAVQLEYYQSGWKPYWQPGVERESRLPIAVRLVAEISPFGRLNFVFGQGALDGG